MSFLFTIENSIAKPQAETLLISPFKEIWDRDISKHKEIAIKEFTYIELMTSKKKTNPYAGYTDEVRNNKLCSMLFDDKNWQPDDLVIQGIAKIIEFQKEASPTYQYYIDNLAAAEKTREFLKTIDLSERSYKTGNPIYKPKDVTSAIIDSEKVILTLAILKDKVEQELFDNVRTRANKIVNPFET
jgi:hypothetical protein